MPPVDDIPCLDALDLAAKRVFIRADLNVPLTRGTPEVADDLRIRQALPTIQHAIEAGARVVIGSHLGRPRGTQRKELSLEPVAARLAELARVEVILPDDCGGDATRKALEDARDGQVVLLENLRFQRGEEKGDEAFARELAEFVDVYVGDAFGVVHRVDASVTRLPRFVAERAMGFRLRDELDTYQQLLEEPERPLVAVVGASRFSDREALLDALLPRVDVLMLAGALANTFLAAQGFDLKASKLEDKQLATARSFLERARDAKVEILLPTDVVATDTLTSGRGTPVALRAMAPEEMAVDVGPETLQAWESKLREAGMIYWEGALGAFERAPFDAGTRSLVRSLHGAPGVLIGVGAELAGAATTSPEHAAAFNFLTPAFEPVHALLEGRTLPGVDALRVN